MPQFDRTGPMGQGSRTGNQKGRCSNKNFSFSDFVLADEERKHKHHSLITPPKGKCHSNATEEHQHGHGHEHECRH